MFSIYKELLLALKKFQIIKITPPQFTFTQQKILPSKIISHNFIELCNCIVLCNCIIF